MTTALRRHHLEEMIARTPDGRVLIAADFDGTLAPIVSHPDSARIPPEISDTLRTLVAGGRVALAILSGRRLDDLASRINGPAILSGNHGLEIAGEGITFQHKVAAERTHLIQQAIAAVGSAVRQWTGAWIEDKHLTATVHYRQVDRRHHHDLAIAIRRAVTAFGCSLGLRAGKASLEIHPRTGWNKGTAVEYIRQQLDMQDCAVLCFGDDTTDEAMFRSLPGHVTVCVGRCVRTAAAFHVPDVWSVGHVLRTFNDLLTEKQDPLGTALAAAGSPAMCSGVAGI